MYRIFVRLFTNIHSFLRLYNSTLEQSYQSPIQTLLKFSLTFRTFHEQFITKKENLDSTGFLFTYPVTTFAQ